MILPVLEFRGCPVFLAAANTPQALACQPPPILSVTTAGLPSEGIPLVATVTCAAPHYLGDGQNVTLRG